MEWNLSRKRQTNKTECQLICVHCGWSISHLFHRATLKPREDQDGRSFQENIFKYLRVL
jgi:hypothetical protein